MGMDDRLKRAADYLLKCKHWDEIRPTRIGPDVLPHLYSLNIERDAKGRASGLPIRFTGTALDQVFGRVLTGRRIGEFIHGPRGKDVLAGFMRSADERIALWMRQVVRIQRDAPRFVEGIAVHVAPERIYGALVTGPLADMAARTGFEQRVLTAPCRA